ncbi:hypothetical protein [Roseobacter sp. GAI101]|uniref:hypothetical protein n=1 Tax=Roseobacter sp. (strain GAI101) TaxID=391589 RepID=UPI0012EDC8B0|nr:hypothetical protein [Roseobacter sp. GAI101]
MDVQEKIQTRLDVSDLFIEPPSQWGFRGDPILWQRLRDRFVDIEQPKCINDFVALIDNAFTAEIGVGMLALDEATLSGFHSDGMSSGMISGTFWRNTALPILLQRFISTHALSQVEDQPGKSIRYRHPSRQ